MLPRLIHPTKIVVSPWDAANTYYDNDMREPIGTVTRSANITISGQPKWTEKDRVSYMVGGAVLNSLGYILFRYVDLQSKGWTPHRQDVILSIGHLTNKWYVVHEKPIGHYSDQNGASLLKVYFADKNPGVVS